MGKWYKQHIWVFFNSAFLSYLLFHYDFLDALNFAILIRSHSGHCHFSQNIIIFLSSCSELFLLHPAAYPQRITKGSLPGFPTQLDIVHRSSTKGCSDHRFRAAPAYTAQLLTLQRHRANNQCFILIKFSRL